MRKVWKIPQRIAAQGKIRMSQSEKASENAPGSCGGNVERGKKERQGEKSGGKSFPQGLCGEKIQYDILVEKCEEKRFENRTNDRKIFFRQTVEMHFHNPKFSCSYKEKRKF